MFHPVKRPESSDDDEITSKNSQKSKLAIFWKKEQFFEEKDENGDAEVLFSTDDALAQNLVRWRICLIFWEKESCFRLNLSLCLRMKTLRAFQKSVQLSKTLLERVNTWQPKFKLKNQGQF